jgi:hypothetical protein
LNKCTWKNRLLFDVVFLQIYNDLHNLDDVFLQIYDDLSTSRSSGLSSECDVQVIITENKDHDVDTSQYQKPAYVAVGLIMTMTCVSVFFPMFVASFSTAAVYRPCLDTCR